jgi:hypothetical protein
MPLPTVEVSLTQDELVTLVENLPEYSEYDEDDEVAFWENLEQKLRKALKLFGVGVY